MMTRKMSRMKWVGCSPTRPFSPPSFLFCFGSLIYIFILSEWPSFVTKRRNAVFIDWDYFHECGHHQGFEVTGKLFIMSIPLPLFFIFFAPCLFIFAATGISQSGWAVQGDKRRIWLCHSSTRRDLCSVKLPGVPRSLIAICNLARASGPHLPSVHKGSWDITDCSTCKTIVGGQVWCWWRKC